MKGPSCYDIFFKLGMAASQGGHFAQWGRGCPPLFYSRRFGVRDRIRTARANGLEQGGVSLSHPPELRLAITEEIETELESLGFELVEIEWAGSKARPIIRVRIDRPDSKPGQGVTLEDCAGASRALEPGLDARPDLPDRYVLEVSSPGVDRPLVRPRDYRRFAGETVAVKGERALADRARRLEGELLDLVDDENGDHRVRMKLPGGDVVEIPLSEITGARVLFRWN